MGMFDTVYFDLPFKCSICGAEIQSVQTKAFENLLNDYRIKDCISHAEDIRIVKEGLFCDKCSKFTNKHIYLVVNRGILTAVADGVQEARGLLNDMNIEKIILWYHDIYKRYMLQRAEKHSLERFLYELIEWYGEGLHKKEKTKDERKIGWLFLNRKHLSGAIGPLEAVHRFLTYKKMLRALDDLKDKGLEVLDIYYPEEMKEGEIEWSVDIYQDDINEECSLNWTWTVMSKRTLEHENEREEDQPDWVIISDAPFSDAVVAEAVKRWLRERGYDFEIKIISPSKARGSGLIKKLKERMERLEDEEMIPAEEVFRHIDEHTKKELAAFIEEKVDRRRVFYYEGLYGSVVPDIQAGRLIGKIEGISEIITYEGNTVSECEENFKKAVLQYLKKRSEQKIHL